MSGNDNTQSITSSNNLLISSRTRSHSRQQASTPITHQQGTNSPEHPASSATSPMPGVSTSSETPIIAHERSDRYSAFGQSKVKYSDYKKNPGKYRTEIEPYVPPLQCRRLALDMIEQAVLASGKNIDETSQPNQQSLFDYGLTQGVYDKDGKPPVR